MYYNNYKKLKRVKKEKVHYRVVEEFRERYNISKSDLAGLMGITSTMYSKNMKLGYFMTYRFLAALDAIENAAHRKLIKELQFIHQARSGLSLDIEE